MNILKANRPRLERAVWLARRYTPKSFPARPMEKLDDGVYRASDGTVYQDRWFTKFPGMRISAGWRRV